MGAFKNMSSMAKPNFHNFISVLLIIYILSDTTIPQELFEVINEPMIKIVLVATCLYIIMHKPVVGCLLLVAMYELMTRNNMKSLPSLVPTFTPELLPSSIISSNVKPSQGLRNKNKVFNNTRKHIHSNYKESNDKRTRIMSKFSANRKRISLEEELVNNVVPYYNHTEEITTIQPILAKQPAKNCVRI